MADLKAILLENDRRLDRLRALVDELRIAKGPPAAAPPHRQRQSAMTRKFKVGDRVEDPDSHRRGVVVHVYTDPGDVIAVRFDDAADALAVHIDDVQKIDRRYR